MNKDVGVPASPSGHSATPEPVVSALRASVPNAARRALESYLRKMKRQRRKKS